MLKRYLIVFAVLTMMVLINGCTDRGDDIVKPNYENPRNGLNAITIGDGHMYAYYLGFSMFNDVTQTATLDTKIYYPKDYQLDGSGIISLPVLYLLSPFRGNANYYFSHKLYEIADRMIEDGEIDPMFIVCVDGSHGFGASFFGDSWAGGKYASMIGEKTGRGSHNDGSVIDYIDAKVYTDQSKQKRAISGFDLGGYGAMRIAIEHSENFGSVSAVTAPLDFDGADGNGGFKTLFPIVAANADEAQGFKNMTVSGDYPLRTMMFGAACSFSPHLYQFHKPWYEGVIAGRDAYALDTSIINDSLTLFLHGGPGSQISFHLPFDENGNIPDSLTVLQYYDTTFTYNTYLDTLSVFDHDSLYVIDTFQIGFLIIIESTLVDIDTIYAYLDTISVDIDTIVNSITTSYDTVGRYDSIWGMWLDNNVENILAAHPNALNSTDIKLFTINEDSYGFNQQTRDFANHLSTTLSKDLTPTNVNGSDDNNSLGYYVYEILPEILKFHSDAFKGNVTK